MNTDNETPVETTSPRPHKGKRVAVIGTALALVAGTAVGVGVYLNRDTDTRAVDCANPEVSTMNDVREVAEACGGDTPREKWLTTGMTQEELEAAYNEIIDEGGGPLGGSDYRAPGKVYPEKMNPLLDVAIGCSLDGGSYDARFHATTLGWCTVPASDDPMLLSNSRFGCVVDGGTWSDTSGRVPDMEASDLPVVAIPGDDTPQVSKVTGTCVLPNQGEPRVRQQMNPDITEFDVEAVRAQCVASGGEAWHPETDPRWNTIGPVNTLYCTLGGIEAARDRFAFAAFATVCWNSGGTFSDWFNKYDTELNGACVPYIGRVMG